MKILQQLITSLPVTLTCVVIVCACAARGITSAVSELLLRNGILLIAKVDGELSDRTQTYAGTVWF